MMEDSSSDDDLPGPSTRSRVKRKEWPDPDDRGGTSSKKVGGGSGRTPQEKNSEEMTKHCVVLQPAACVAPQKF